MNISLTILFKLVQKKMKKIVINNKWLDCIN